MTRDELNRKVTTYKPTPWSQGYEESGDAFLVRKEWERINLADMPFDTMLSYRKAMNMPFDKFDREWVIDQMHSEYETVESRLADYDLLSASGLDAMDDLYDMHERTADDLDYVDFWSSVNAPTESDVDDYATDRANKLAELEKNRDDFYRRLFNYQMVANTPSYLKSVGLKCKVSCAIPDDQLPPEYEGSTKDIQTAYYQHVFAHMKDRADYGSYLDTSILDAERSARYRIPDLLPIYNVNDMGIDCSRPSGGGGAGGNAGACIPVKSNECEREGFDIDALSDSDSDEYEIPLF